MRLSRPIRLVAIVFTLMAVGEIERSLAEDGLREKLATKVEPRLKSKELVGVVVGLIDPELPKPLVFGFGKTAIDGAATPDGDSLFEIGSVTKVFTATALAVLVEEGRAKLDEPVVSLLPKGTVVPTHDGKSITLEHLATHTSSLPRIPPIVFARALTGKDPYDEVKEKDIYDFLSKWTPKQPIGKTYDYSNLGAGLLGMALAQRAGVSYEELIRSRISMPLRLDSTWNVVPDDQMKRLVKPYRDNGKAASYWKFEALAGCGGLKSSVNDMLRFLSANLNAERVEKPLGPALLAARSPRHKAMGERVKIALGWHVTESTPVGKPVYWHNGGTGGFRSFIGFVPTTGRAVVVLSNSDASVDALGFDALRLLRETSKQRELEKTSGKTVESR